MREQNRRFDAALNNMTHGLCMFDEDLRITVFNNAISSIFGTSPEVGEARHSVGDLLDAQRRGSETTGRRAAEELYATYGRR